MTCGESQRVQAYFDDELDANTPSPEYTAVIECVPTGRVDTVSAAVPLARDDVPRNVPPS